MESQVLVLYGT